MTTITYTDGYLHVSTDDGDSCFQASKAEVLKFLSTLRLEYKVPVLTEDHSPIPIGQLAVGDLVIFEDDTDCFYGIVVSVNNDEHHNEIKIDEAYDLTDSEMGSCRYCITLKDVVAVYRYYGEPQKNGLYKDTNGKYFWRYSYGGADERPWIKLTGASPEWTFFDDIRYVIQFPLTMIAEME